MSDSINQIINRALGFHRQGNINKAEQFYTKALTQDPNHSTALHFLGVIRHQQGRNLEAENLITQALRITPDDIMMMSNLGTTYFALHQFQKAEKLFTKVLSKEPHNHQILTNRGNTYQSLGHMAKAVDDYHAALRLNPNLFEAARNLGLCLQKGGFLKDAKNALEHSVNLAPHRSEARISLANLYRESSQHEAARIQYETALKLTPSIPQIHCDLAITLRDMGNLALAENHFAKAVKIDPQLGRAWRGLAGLKTFQGSSDLNPMRAALINSDDDQSKMHLNFALGKAEEDIENFEAAFSHFKSANELDSNSFKYNPGEDFSFFKKLRSIFSSEFIKFYSGNGIKSKQPIFIVGMPRSGTSLVEQILASHSQVFGAGELGLLANEISKVFPMRGDLDYSHSLKKAQAGDFTRLASGYLNQLKHKIDTSLPYIVDKMPMNFIHIGLIVLALPSAKIIHCKRDPMDNCLSIYKNYLPAAGHEYAKNLLSLGQYYKEYQTLMAHWQEKFSENIYEVEYEKLTNSPKREISALLKACGLDFEIACLSSHKTKRIVSTLSAAQVRKPIHNKSIGLWKKYEANLELLKKEFYSN